MKGQPMSEMLDKKKLAKYVAAWIDEQDRFIAAEKLGGNIVKEEFHKGAKFIAVAIQNRLKSGEFDAATDIPSSRHQENGTVKNCDTPNCNETRAQDGCKASHL